MGSLKAEPAVAPIPKGASAATCSNFYTKHTSDEKARWDSTVIVLNTAKTKATSDLTKRTAEVATAKKVLKAFEDKLNSPAYVTALKSFNESTEAAAPWAELYFASKAISNGKLNSMLA